LELSGSYNADDCEGLKSLQVYVDGRGVEDISIDGHVWKATAEGYCTVNGNPEEKTIPPWNLLMVIVVASAENGSSCGKLLFV
jgi:hypothetical protein